MRDELRVGDYPYAQSVGTLGAQRVQRTQGSELSPYVLTDTLHERPITNYLELEIVAPK